MTHVVGDEHRAERDRVSGDHRVAVTDGATTRLQSVTNLGIGVSSISAPRNDGDFCQKSSGRAMDFMKCREYLNSIDKFCPSYRGYADLSDSDYGEHGVNR